MPGWIQALDETVLLWVQNALRTPLLNGAMEGFSTLGNAGLLFIVASVLMLFWRKTRRAGVVALCAMAVGFLCTNVVLKPLVARPRPWVTLPSIVPLLAEHDPFSFPSGHTTAAFAAAVAWCSALTDRRVRAAALICAVLMAFSRLYVGVHYPSDVLAGAAIGAACAVGCAHLERRRKRGSP